MGKQYRVKCHGTDQSGKGIITFNNKRFSVPYLLDGETASIELNYQKQPVEARLVAIETPSSQRVKPPCPIFNRCGGCSLLHTNYSNQLEMKKQAVVQMLGSFGSVSDPIGMETPFHYRNKVHATFAKGPRGSIISGIYEEDTHNVISAEQCLIQDEIADKIIKSIRNIMKALKLNPYDEDQHTGLLRHVLIRRGFSSNQTLVVLVTGSTDFPGKKRFLSELLLFCPEITSVVWNINSRKTSMVLGEQESILYGDGYIEDTLCGLNFRISSKSFYQINPIQTEKLYQKALEFASLTGNETVLDAYCGVGTIALIAASSAKEIIGVELNPTAIKDAIQNAQINKINNVRFICSDAGEQMVKMTRTKQMVDVVFIDPPRTGCSQKFLDSLINMKPQKIVYISCNLETQKRDLGIFIKKGYQVEKIQPLDMFPWTGHVETCVLLSHKKPDDIIEVKMEY